MLSGFGAGADHHRIRHGERRRHVLAPIDLINRIAGRSAARHRNDARIESLGLAGDRVADRAQADDADHGAGERANLRHNVIVPPAPGALVGREVRQAPHQREQERERMLGDHRGLDAGGIGDGRPVRQPHAHAAIDAGGGEVDPAQHRAGATPQRRPIGGRAHPVAGDQDRGIADLARHLLGRTHHRPLQLRKVPLELDDRVLGPERVENSLHEFHRKCCTSRPRKSPCISPAWRLERFHMDRNRNRSSIFACRIFGRKTGCHFS
jgi:hypothetical protein